jgi:homoserine dehydrogenase
VYKIAMIGFGVVGQGFAGLLESKAEFLRKDTGLEVRLVAIADSQKGSVIAPEGIGIGQALAWAGDGKSLNLFPGKEHGLDAVATIERCDADILFEASWTDIKTAEPATTHIRRALAQGMHVVTTNKGPLALHAHKLLAEAKDRGLELRFEGTVMSGTPLLNLARYCLAGCQISEIRGILNGTTNFILTQMSEGGSYGQALKTAQDLGYAEAVPDADVLGWDALAKVCILANTVFGAEIHPDPKTLTCVGITGIKAEDIESARKAGQVYKLIGRVWREDGRVRVSVSPQRVPQEDPLAGVSGAGNALTFTTDALGEVTIKGPGAGKMPTGYAMLVDLLDIHRALTCRKGD